MRGLSGGRSGAEGIGWSAKKSLGDLGGSNCQKEAARKTDGSERAQGMHSIKSICAGLGSRASYYRTEHPHQRVRLNGFIRGRCQLASAIAYWDS